MAYYLEIYYDGDITYQNFDSEKAARYAFLDAIWGMLFYDVDPMYTVDGVWAGGTRAALKPVYGGGYRYLGYFEGKVEGADVGKLVHEVPEWVAEVL